MEEQLEKEEQEKEAILAEDYEESCRLEELAIADTVRTLGLHLCGRLWMDEAWHEFTTADCHIRRISVERGS